MAPRYSTMAIAVCAIVLSTTINALAASDKPQLRILTDRTEAHLAPLFAEFEKKTNVKISVVYLDKGLITRLESRPTEADLVITKDADLLEVAKQKRLIQPFSSTKIKESIPTEFRDSANFYFSDSYRARAIFYSKDRVKPESLSTYEGLADPKWKGKICLRSGYHDYNISLFSQMWAAWGPERTKKFVIGLKANLARTPIGSDRDQAKAILEKKCDVALINSYYMGIMLSSAKQRDWGLATKIFFPDQASKGTFILRSALALTKAKTNAKTATAFLEFMADQPSQEMITNLTFAYPARKNISLPEINRQIGQAKNGEFKIQSISLADSAKYREEVIKLLDEIQFDRPR